MLNYYRCKKCKAETSHIAINSEDIPEDILAKLALYGGLSGEFAIGIDSNTVLCRVDGQYYLVKGYTEAAALQHLKAELAVVEPEVQTE